MDYFLNLFVHWRREKAHPVPTKVFLKLSLDMTMLFPSFRCTHPPPVLLFLLTQNLTPKDIAGSDIITS